jgi:hypothetical protein
MLEVVVEHLMMGLLELVALVLVEMELFLLLQLTPQMGLQIKVLALVAILAA